MCLTTLAGPVPEPALPALGCITDGPPLAHRGAAAPRSHGHGVPAGSPEPPAGPAQRQASRSPAGTSAPLSASPRHHVWRGRTGPGPAAPPRSARRPPGHSLASAAAASAPPLPPAASAFCPSRSASPGNRRRGGAGRGAVPARAPSPADGAERGESVLPTGATRAAGGTDRAWRERGQGGQPGWGRESRTLRPLPQRERRPALPGRAAPGKGRSRSSPAEAVINVRQSYATFGSQSGL